MYFFLFSFYSSSSYLKSNIFLVSCFLASDCLGSPLATISALLSFSRVLRTHHTKPASSYSIHRQQSECDRQSPSWRPSASLPPFLLIPMVQAHLDTLRPQALFQALLLPHRHLAIQVPPVQRHLHPSQAIRDLQARLVIRLRPPVTHLPQSLYILDPLALHLGALLRATHPPARRHAIHHPSTQALRGYQVRALLTQREDILILIHTVILPEAGLIIMIPQPPIPVRRLLLSRQH
jgi:hypothetical protein